MGASSVFAHPLTGERRLTDRIGKGSITAKLEVVATGLTAPNGGTASPVPGDGRLFVTDQNGILWAIDTATGVKSVFLDMSGRLVAPGFAGPGTFDERGFLGVAFHPDYATNGLVYTYTSEPTDSIDSDFPVPEGAAANHHAVVAEWQVPNPDLSTSVVDPTTRREVLRVGEPQFNHDGGALNFGPDDMLYISLGDGGGGNDVGDGHTASGNGQDTSNVLGAILRIDPQGSDSANGR